MSDRPRGLTDSLTALFAIAAGATSLSFEILWARRLGLEVGGPLAAFTIVVSSYLAGLAAGAACLGRMADRVRNPARAFGTCQLVVASMGAAGALLSGGGGLTRHALAASGASPGEPGFLALEILLAGTAVFLPAFLMGGTLPLLLNASSASRQSAAWCGRLAALNAAGAACGALGCGFYLLPEFGLRGSLLITSAMTAAIGLASWIGVSAGQRRGATRAAGATAATPERGRSQAARTAGPAKVLAALFAAGLAVSAMEVVWARLGSLAFGSSSQSGSLVLAAVIGGLAIGNAAGARLAARDFGGSRLMPVLLCGGAASLLLSDPILGRLPWLAARFSWLLAGPGESVASVGEARLLQILLMLIVSGLPCILAGALFAPAYAALRRGGLRPGRLAGESAGAASAAGSAGSLLGAPLAYVALLAGTGSRGCLLGASSVLSLGALLSASGAGARLAGGALLAASLGAGTFGAWDPAIISAGPFLYGRLYAPEAGQPDHVGPEIALRARGEVIFVQEGPEALVTVRRLPEGTLSMQVNGKTDASTGGDMKTQTLVAQLPLLLRAAAGALPDAPRVLVVGLGSGVSAASALTHPGVSVSVVELSPEVAAAARRFETANRGVLEHPRLELTIGDARSRLRFLEETFDVIVSQPSNPWVAGQAALFTREFFSLTRSRLRPGGVVCQWIQGYGLSPDDFRSVVRTFSDVFPSVSLWEESTAGGDYLLIGSTEPFLPDPDRLRRAASHPDVAADLERVEIDGAAGLLSHFVMGDESIGRFASGARLHVEDRLDLEFTAPSALHRETLGEILRSLEPYRTDPAGLVPGDLRLAAEVRRLARRSREERAWAAGLGLMDPGGRLDPELLMALSWLRSGMKGAALEAMRDLAMRRPAERLVRLVLAHLLMSEGRVEDAARELATAVALRPDDARGRLYLARALYASGRIEEALGHNEMAVRLDPALAEAGSDRCAMLLAAGDIASAEAACLAATRLDADLAQAHANLGVVRAHRGRLAEAEASYRRAIELDPELSDPRYNLAALLQRAARWREGLETLGPLLGPGVEPDAAVLILAARLSAGAGDRSEAARYLEASRRLDPENPELETVEVMLR